jgi:hypothetical protein
MAGVPPGSEVHSLEVHMKALALLALATLVIPEDCYLGGPYVADDGSSCLVLDNGSSGNTNSTGCDGCTATIDVDVIWFFTGNAIMVSPGGDEWEFGVVPWDVTTVRGTYGIACNGIARWDFITPTGGGGAWATCTACL